MDNLILDSSRANMQAEMTNKRRIFQQFQAIFSCGENWRYPLLLCNRTVQPRANQIQTSPQKIVNLHCV
jgi:hypothetical protein